MCENYSYPFKYCRKKKTKLLCNDLKKYLPLKLLFRTFQICFAKWIYSVLKIHRDKSCF